MGSKTNSGSSQPLQWLGYGPLLLVVLVAVGPFLWLLATALKGPNENIFAYPPQLLPQQPSLDAFKTVWKEVPLLLYFGNSVVVTTLTIALNVGLSILAGYPLARMSFPGKGVLVVLVLLTMMIPFQVIMIPLYLLILNMGLTEANGWLAAWLGLALPFAVSGFGIFFMRQAFLSIPRDLDEAALLDGANAWQRLVHVLVPLVRPAVGVLAIFTLLAAWGEFLWPSIVLSQDQFFTLPVGLVQLQGQFSSNWRLIAAGTVLAMLPAVVVFVVLQRVFLQSALEGAIKG